MSRASKIQGRFKGSSVYELKLCDERAASDASENALDSGIN